MDRRGDVRPAARRVHRAIIIASPGGLCVLAVALAACGPALRTRQPTPGGAATEADASKVPDSAATPATPVATVPAPTEPTSDAAPDTAPDSTPEVAVDAAAGRTPTAEPAPPDGADAPAGAEAGAKPATPAAPAAEPSKQLAEALSGQLGSGGLSMRGTGRGAGGQGQGGLGNLGTIGHGSGSGSGSGYGRGHGTVGRVRVAAPQVRGHQPFQHARPPFNTEGYAHVDDNPFHRVADQPLSTFSVDVDTASYSNVRRMLGQGTRPPIDAVRTEELINYFSYDYPAPRGEAPFSIYTEVASAPWSPRHRLVHVGLSGREIEAADVPARNLVFLLDVSGSMGAPDKLPLLQRGMALLIRQLRPQDRLTIVAYAGASGLVLPPTSGRQQGRMLAALEHLQAGGSTNGGSGIQLAYRMAQEQFIRGGINRVILATDGDFNVGVTDQGALTRLIEQKRKGGVFLTVLGFGQGNLEDSTMELLADKGNGNYAYIDSLHEARKVLVREAGSTLVTIAKDVKLQIEWNPRLVASYRLIGYENRVLSARDFNDDEKDAGEIGAGHSVTALYEVVLAGAHGGEGEVDALRYQGDRALTSAADSDELLTVKVRYKRPDGERSKLLKRAVVDAGTRLGDSSRDFRFAAAVAGFGMLLRGSEHRGDASIDLVRQLAREALGSDPHGDRRELIELMDAAERMGVGRDGSSG